MARRAKGYTAQKMRIRSKRDPFRSKHSVEDALIERLSPKPPPDDISLHFEQKMEEVEEGAPAENGPEVGASLASAFADAEVERRKEVQGKNGSIFDDLNRTSLRLTALVQRISNEVHGTPWERSTVIERGNQVVQHDMTGKLKRQYKGKFQWCYRSEIWDHMDEDMREFMGGRDGWWQNWKGRKRITVELVRKITTKKYYMALEAAEGNVMTIVDGKIQKKRARKRRK